MTCHKISRSSRRFATLVLALRSGHPLPFTCPADVRIVCLSGTAWITTEGDIRDVVLQAGQAHDACRGDRTVINGMPICELRIE